MKELLTHILSMRRLVRATPEVACFQSEMIMIIYTGVTSSTNSVPSPPGGSTSPDDILSGVGISSVGIYIRLLAVFRRQWSHRDV